jgi:carbon storage regulator
MLVLTRKSNQSLMIGDDVEVTVLAVWGEKVKLGIEAPRDVRVFRTEVYRKRMQEEALAGGSSRAEVDEALRRLGDKR